MLVAWVASSPLPSLCVSEEPFLFLNYYCSWCFWKKKAKTKKTRGGQDVAPLSLFNAREQKKRVSYYALRVFSQTGWWTHPGCFDCSALLNRIERARERACCLFSGPCMQRKAEPSPPGASSDICNQGHGEYIYHLEEWEKRKRGRNEHGYISTDNCCIRHVWTYAQRAAHVTTEALKIHIPHEYYMRVSPPQ